ncbi:hypothetical protein [Mesorhizobium sp. A623]
MDKATRKAAFRALFRASGLTVDSAPAVVGISRSMIASWLRDLENDTTLGPKDEILERFREIVIGRTKDILVEAWIDEARNPLVKEDFLRPIMQQLDFKISYEDEHGVAGDVPSSYPIDIVGRSGLLDRINVPRKGRDLSEMQDEILSKAWDHYRRQTNRILPVVDPAQQRHLVKDRFRSLRNDLKMKNKDIAEATGYSIGSVNAWFEPLKSNMPPDGVIRELGKIRHKWALDILVAAEADRPLSLSYGSFEVPETQMVMTALEKYEKTPVAA